MRNDQFGPKEAAEKSYQKEIQELNAMRGQNVKERKELEAKLRAPNSSYLPRIKSPSPNLKSPYSTK